MKPSLLALACSIVSLTVASAQTKRSEYAAPEKEKNFRDRLEMMIEDFVDKVGREFVWRENETDSLGTVGSEESLANAQDKSGSTLTFDGNKTIGESETMRANVVVKGGDLTVYGTIEGDALVVGGNLFVKDGGKISGNARVINGEIVKDEEGFIGGSMDMTRASAVGYRQDRRTFGRSSYQLNAQWASETTNLDNFLFRYNRVEGIFLGLGSEKKYYWDGSKRWNAYGSVGWGFKSHRWRYNLGLTRQFALANDEASSSGLFEIGAEGHSLTDSKDHWIIGLHENTAAALLIHEDFRDYYGREGFALHTAYSMQQGDLNGQLKTEYLIDRYSSLVNRTEWSIFGGNKVFRPNPAVDEGAMRSVLVSGGLSTVTKTSHGQEGWSIYGNAEYARKSWGGIFSFSQLVADIRRYQPIGYYDNFNIRLRVGTSTGTVPFQKVFELGGRSTVHARPFKSEIGNRMILLNAEYIINGDFLHDLDFWPSWLMRGINFLVLADAGLIRSVGPEEKWTGGFEATKLSEFKSDVGFGLANRNGSLRLAFVWRTDVNVPAKFIFRFSRPF